MEGMNKVFLLGRLGSAPKSFTDKKGRPFTRLSLATDRTFATSTEGEEKKDTKTEWHNIFVWGKKGELCNQFLKTGSPVMVEGSISYSDTLDDKGNHRYSSSIFADRITFLPDGNRRKSEAVLALN